MKAGKSASEGFLTFGLLSLMTLSACMAPMPEPAPAPPPEPKKPKALFAPLSVSAIPGFAEDEIIAALPALKRSCQKITSLPADRGLGPDAIGGRAADWAEPCQVIESLSDDDEEGLRDLLLRQLGMSPLLLKSAIMVTPRGPSPVITRPNLRGAWSLCPHQLFHFTSHHPTGSAWILRFLIPISQAARS